MASEPKRGCGYRKVGGIYLMGDGGGMACCGLPFELSVCAACGHGIKQSRGWTTVSPDMFDFDRQCSRTVVPTDPSVMPTPYNCPLVRRETFCEKAGLIWIGAQHYTPEAFEKEAREMGISRRLSAVPKDLVLGETWVFLAHPHAIVCSTCGGTGTRPEQGDQVDAFDEEAEEQSGKCPDCKKGRRPGVIKVFKPTALEIIVTDRQAKDEEAMEALRARKLTPVVVPHDDPDHQPKMRKKAEPAPTAEPRKSLWDKMLGR